MKLICGIWIVFCFIVMMIGYEKDIVSFSDSITIVLLVTIAIMIHIHVFKDSNKDNVK
jgi:hypothetical protein